MKITPLEIRQKAFATQFRGYDKDEVDAFLLSMSQEWERVNLQLKEQQVKLESTDKELDKLRQVESSLFKTLKTAEDTSSSLIQQANKSAELQIKETQMNAEALLNDARILAKDMIEEAEFAIKNSYELMNAQLKELENDYKSVEAARSNLLDELRSLGTNLLDKAQRSEEKDFDLNKLDRVTDYKNVKAIIDPLNEAFVSISKTKIGIVPQELNIDPFFTPHELLELQAGLYGIPKKNRKTDEILENVGLIEQRNAYARTLSGGMRRRLLVAKAIVHDQARHKCFLLFHLLLLLLHVIY